MTRRSLLLSVLFLILMVFPTHGGESPWTEKKIGKMIVKADRAARQKKWALAIKLGERMLGGSDILDQHSDPRYINLLKKLNKYYDKAGRLSEVSPRLEEAYHLSLSHLRPTHETVLISRNLYYKYLISAKDYQKAIPLVLENIAAFEGRNNEGYRLLHYYKQLYSLYGLTAQLEKEQDALLDYLKLNKELLGYEDEDNLKIILILAQNYCRQEKFDAFTALTQAHNLKYYCK